jgi:hypothetical protein
LIPDGARWTFSGELWYWRGPSPHHFTTVPDHVSAELRAMSSVVSYGWGVIPVRARVGRTAFETSLFPKDGGYVLPIKDAVRNAEHLDDGDAVAVEMAIRSGPARLGLP